MLEGKVSSQDGEKEKVAGEEKKEQDRRSISKQDRRYIHTEQKHAFRREKSHFSPRRTYIVYKLWDKLSQNLG